MNLSPLFRPSSVALIGASTDETSVGHSLAKNLLTGFSGAVYFVNPKATTLLGAECFPSVEALPATPDLAIVAVPAKVVPAVLTALGRRGIGAAVIISSGFKEIGPEGKKLENELIGIAKEHGVALLGPNCLGIILPHLSLNASFATALPKAGSIALFSQSGALLTAILDRSREILGFSACVSTGNKAIIAERELLSYFAQDDATKVIGFYSEDLVDAPALIETAQAILARGTPKPIVVLKAGTTGAGSEASSSHTGALAGSDAAYSALFDQAGIIRAQDLSEFLALLEAFSTNPLPTGRRVGIVTNAGGLGVMATDAAAKNGLQMARLSPEHEKTLAEALPKAANVKNPIDVLGDARSDRYELAFNTVLGSDDIDSLIMIVSPQAMTEGKQTADALVSARDRSQKPIIAVLAGGAGLEAARETLRAHGIAVTDTPESAARLIGALTMVGSAREFGSAKPFPSFVINESAARDIIQKARKQGREQLFEEEALGVLAAYGFRPLAHTFVRSREEAKAAIEKIGRPCALKIVSPDIIHKSDVGGVRLDIASDGAEDAYDALIETVRGNAADARIEGALVVEMAETGGTELILGAKREPGLGTVLLVGLGGIFVEIFHDTTLRFAPISPKDAHAMLADLQSFPLLTGARGKESIDVSAIEESLGRLSRLVLDFSEIEELDMNPLLVFPEQEKFRLVDARIRIVSAA